MRRLLFVLAGAALLGACNDGPPGPTLEGTSPPIDGELAPDATLQPEGELAPEVETEPAPTLEPETTLQPDSVLAPE